MMKVKNIRVAIIAGQESTGESIKNQLSCLLGQYILFYSFSINEWIENRKNYDLVLVSTQTVFTTDPSFKVNANTETLVIRRTLLKTCWERILGIPKGKRLLLFNDNRDSAEETSSLIYELGARHIDLIPSYPGLENMEQSDYIVTPGETQFLEQYDKEIIDIGERVVDVSTLVDILSRFDLFNEETRIIVNEYAKKIVPRSYGLQTTMQSLIDSTRLLQGTLNIVQDAVITYDENFTVTFLNRSAEQLFHTHSWEVIGKKLDELLPKEILNSSLLDDDLHDHLIKYLKQTFILNNIRLVTNEMYTGGVITLQVAKKVEELELKLRYKSSEKGYSARYSFEDIITDSKEIKETINRAKKMAKSNLSVLVLGESGTGKELFAHAIHDYSFRSLSPFVAVNCSALPDALIESELFGYEEGAFTGAKKGGKPGLFEQAHKGTIFLDEIGDISPQVQSRLLRVIQQKEVLKVGGTKLIPVDVRIIAATNKDLRKLVEQGNFRGDLYYRLKVLQLNVLPLRERREDIVMLANHFLGRRTGASLNKNIAKYFLKYDWLGNIRELENTIEYLSIMCESSIEVDDLPFLEDLKKQDDMNNVQNLKEPKLNGGTFVWTKLGDEELAIQVLKVIGIEKKKGNSIGRRGIYLKLTQQGILISESEIRKMIERLRYLKLINVKKGRAGCDIAQAGIDYLNGTFN